MVVKCISSSAEADLNCSVGFCSVSGICGCVRVCVCVCGFCIKSKIEMGEEHYL